MAGIGKRHGPGVYGGYCERSSSTERQPDGVRFDRPAWNGEAAHAASHNPPAVRPSYSAPGRDEALTEMHRTRVRTAAQEAAMLGGPAGPQAERMLRRICTVLLSCLSLSGAQQQEAATVLIPSSNDASRPATT
ncbi:hypothetical protein [Xanthomonas melonis]|uniref:hypothetical protein n=1 Tax=Xanthomonas melonis TaxID=56456 RepID=UPI0011B07CA3|nr:hypothetical protein [Xanthomonas melonis]